jgi:hypothetical protein
VRKIITTLLVVIALTVIAESSFHGRARPLTTAQPTAASPIQPQPSVTNPETSSIPAGVLPNPRLTPGAVSTTDTYTVCHRSTRLIRPPASYTGTLKREQIVEYGYTDTIPADFEEDHLVPLELGGDPRDTRNLWPESRRTFPGAAQKDKVENALHEQVCFGGLALTIAQSEIAANWYAVWVKIGRP